MQERNALIEVVDETGRSLGHKERKDVDKRKDILRAVYVLVENAEGKLLLARSQSDPIYPNLWGCSAAGLIRHGETAEDAAKRTVKRELGINVVLEETGSGFYDFSGVKRWMWMYRAMANAVQQSASMAESYELTWFSMSDASSLIKKGKAMPMLEPQLSALKSK